MSKTHLYFLSGLAANSKIFEHLQLDSTKYECHFLEWKIPLTKDEPIQSYAQRMCKEITHKNPVLIGVSFGGVMVQEISKLINTKKVIIISSIKSTEELPKRLKLVQLTKVYKLFPAKFIENIDEYIDYFLGDYQQKRVQLYKKYMSVRNALYLHWAIDTVLHWQQDIPIKNTVHIHGTKDTVFPIKHIQNCIEINDGNHAMIITKAKRITQEISKALTCN
ncbi:MAG: alpha/beta hydrolase [Flavobacteriaceae bacterium]|nr:alpha/beta hydrolase [Flavobacteriaceae bacterium]